MSWKIWKPPSERAKEEFENGYRKGFDHSNWNLAFSYFNSAYRLYNKAKDQTNARVALALATFSFALSESEKIENWRSAESALQNLGNTVLDIVQTIPAEILAQECQLKALELQTETVRDLSEKMARLEKLAESYLSLSERTLTISLLIEKHRTSGQIKAQRILAEATKIKEQIELAYGEQIKLWRKGEIKPDANNRIQLPCGCIYEEIPAGLSRLSDQPCHFHGPSENMLILKTETRRKTANGLLEPEYVQAIHDVISVKENASIEEISRQTGLNRETVSSGLDWLVDEDAIFIPNGWWNNQHATQQKEKRPKILEREIARTRTSQKDLVGQLLNFLNSHSYQTEVFESYVVAMHERNRRVFLIKIEDARSCVQYSKLKTVILPFYRFQTFIKQLERASRSIDVSLLKTDVITVFGWHAEAAEEVRHAALELASEVWGVQYILNLLKLLLNMWKNNPMLEHHAPVAKDDYKWFEKERSTLAYHREKRELIEKLEKELLTLGIPSEFRRFFSSLEDIDRWFVVTYC